MINKLKDIQMESSVKLNTAAMSLINVIDLNPGMSMTDLSKRMDLTKSAVSQMLKKLCALGLLKKCRDAAVEEYAHAWIPAFKKWADTYFVSEK